MNGIDVKKVTAYWIEQSKDDLESVEQFLGATDKSVQAMFFLHLSIEKILKALFVHTLSQHAPLTHNLLYLCEKINLELNQEYDLFLSQINEFNLECRYPNEKRRIRDSLNKQKALEYLKKGQAFHSWILQKFEKKE